MTASRAPVSGEHAVEAIRLILRCTDILVEQCLPLRPASVADVLQGHKEEHLRGLQFPLRLLSRVVGDKLFEQRFDCLKR